MFSFSVPEERVLEYLAKHCCFSTQTAKRWEAMSRDLSKKIPDLESVLGELVNKQVVGVTKKGKAGKIHYYASTGILSYLKARGLWSPSRVHLL